MSSGEGRIAGLNRSARFDLFVNGCVHIGGRQQRQACLSCLADPFLLTNERVYEGSVAILAHFKQQDDWLLLFPTTPQVTS